MTYCIESEQFDQIKEQLDITTDSEYLDNIIAVINENNYSNTEWNAVSPDSSMFDKMVAVEIASRIEQDEEHISMRTAVERHTDDIEDYMSKADLIKYGYKDIDRDAVFVDALDETYIEINDSDRYVAYEKVQENLSKYIEQFNALSDEEKEELAENNTAETEAVKTILEDNSIYEAEDMSEECKQYIAQQALEHNCPTKDEIIDWTVEGYDGLEDEMPEHWLEWDMKQAEYNMLYIMDNSSYDYPIQVDDDSTTRRYLRTGVIGSALTDELLNESQQTVLKTMSQEDILETIQDYPQLVDDMDWSETALSEKQQSQLNIASTLQGKDRDAFLAQMTSTEEIEAFELPADLLAECSSENTDYETALTKAQEVSQAQKSQDRDR